MELLVATLAHTAKGNHEDALARVRLVVDTVKNAPGIIHVRFYASRESDAYYFMLTSWEDEDFWQKAQERYNPKELLVNSGSELFTGAPEQWLMHYLWGYSRPSAQPTIAAAHLATVRPDQSERIQRDWIEGLQRQAIQPTLAFAFLARGRYVDASSPVSRATARVAPTSTTDLAARKEPAFSSTFLNLLSWPGETQQREFYGDQNYRAIRGLLTTMGIVRVLTLEPQS